MQQYPDSEGGVAVFGEVFQQVHVGVGLVFGVPVAVGGALFLEQVF